MRQLRTALERRFITGLAHWDNLPDQGSEFHRKRAEEFISAADFAVLIIDGSVFDNNGKQGVCAQEAEASFIRARQLRAQGGGGGPFHVMRVIVQDECGFPQPREVQDALPDKEIWVADITSTYFVSPQVRAQDVATRMATDLLHWLYEREPAAPSRQGQSRTAPQKAAGARKARPGAAESGAAHPVAIDFAKLELDYLRRAVRSWVRGQIGEEGERRKMRKRAVRDAFVFTPARFIEFTATARIYDDRDSDGVGGESAQHISHWLFSSQPHPLIVLGEGGAGKTTALTAAACGFASVWGDAFQAECQKIAGGWLDKATDKLRHEPQYVPLVMRCIDICEAMTAHDASRNPFLDAIIDHLWRAAQHDAPGPPTPDDRDAFRAHLISQPHVLMFDGLDEVGDTAAAERLYRAARSLALDIESRADASHPSRMRIIFTSRPDHPIVEERVEIALTPPLMDWDSVARFIDRFTEKPRERLVLKERARVLVEAGDGRNAPLKTPLLLNAFCCIARLEELDDTYKFRFCREVVDYFLHDRDFAVLAAAMGQGALHGGAAEIARELLEHLAYVMVRSGNASLRRDQALREVLRVRARLGLAIADLEHARDVLEDISSEFPLFSATRDEYGFPNAALFAEYLAGERLAADTSDADVGDGGLVKLAADAARLRSPLWRGALRFAQALRRFRGGMIDDAASLEVPHVLVTLAEEADDPELAWFGCQTALEMISEGAPGASFDGHESPLLVALGTRVRDLLRREFEHWSVKQRTVIVDLFYRCGRRADPRQTMESVDRLGALLLEPRRRWIAAAHDLLPRGLQLASTPVLVAEFHAFVHDAGRHDDALWVHAPTDADRLTVVDHEAQTRDARALRDHWIAQLERPGAAVVDVSWFEADAFCRWRTQQLRVAGRLGEDEVVRLPTWEEWRALMQWAYGGAEYPCEAHALEHTPGRLNWKGAGAIGPTAPGVFAPSGAEGLYDFGSNVRCWLAPSGPESGWAQELDLGAAVVGGAWSRDEGYLRTRATPNGASPRSRFADVGMRLVRARRV